MRRKKKCHWKATSLCLITSSARLVNDHYCIGLPLKDESLIMPNNHCITEHRVINFKGKLRKNADFHEDYKTFVKEILESGYAVQVPREQLSWEQLSREHHGVYHPEKKKIPVVLDCTASYKGVSLNEQLLQGPNLTNTLVGVLTRFRQNRWH